MENGMTEINEPSNINYTSSTDSNNNKKMNLYIIDKSDMITNLLKDHMKSAGYDITITYCENQKEGVNSIGSESNTIVLCGVTGNGFETAIGQVPWAQLSIDECVERIKSRNPRAKVAVFTGGTFTEDDAYAAGADGYIFKPEMFDIVDGKIKIVRALEKLL